MNEDDYRDIINLPHHEPRFRPRMSMLMRAAQFSSFDALTGLNDSLRTAESQKDGEDKTDIDYDNSI